MSEQITWQQFEAVELRVGTVIAAEEFPQARKPAYKLTVDFGENIGMLRSSAQITVNYLKESLIGTQVIAVVNFPAKQIGPFKSECLVTGFEDESGNVVLARPSSPVPNGSRMF